ncbi:LEA type 2 family protein [Chitinibacter bivalviorum]|uniref:LEA type 2 family protein n=1 Tax=Chitinibacter bivalviorum TaxID=2739434 RepID=A0A7H9BEH2_9NEIS|nr:LEA type 2 family protein [Chitinibacter bivalviorum]QLG87123.1 LEA type 2 family protein [Chitinibacter bivalviorum]
MLKRLLLIILAAILAACSAIPAKFEAPQVNLAGISVAKLGVFEQQFVLSLRVSNPNDFDIPINGLTVNLDVNNQPFAQGVSNEKITLPRLGEKIVKLNVTTSLSNVWKQVQKLQKGDAALAYKVYGKVYAPLVPTGFSFERKGELNGLGDFAVKSADKI